MDFSTITAMYIPIVLVACLVIGYILKKWIADLNNKWIPTILAIVGACLGIITNGLSLEAVVAGAVTGLASTGLHQLFKQQIDGGKMTDEFKDMGTDVEEGEDIE